MRRSSILVRLATNQGLIEPGKGPALLGRFKTEGKGRPFEIWAAETNGWPEDRVRELQQAYNGLTFICQACEAQHLAVAMTEEELVCGTCGDDGFNIEGMPQTDSKPRRSLAGNVATPPPAKPSEDVKIGASGRHNVVPANNPEEVLLEVESESDIKLQIAEPKVMSISGAATGTPPPAPAMLPPPPPPPAPSARPLSETMGEVLDLKRPLTPGTVIGNAEIVGRAGEGGMGTVYKARHRTLDRLVAVKVITPDRLASQQALLRFRREAQVLAKFDHPNIVQVYDFGEIGGGAYLTMQWIEGKGLEKVLEKGGKLPLKDAIRIILATAKALATAHEEGIIHRDLKPDNILIGKDGQPKLADFGLARVDQANAAKLTAGDAMLGTPLYMAPEQTDGEAGTASDIYSLGCTLYHMIAGKPPFVGTTVWDLLRKHIQEPFPSIRKFVPEVPQALDELLQRMGSKKPKERPEKASEVATTLEQILMVMDGSALTTAMMMASLGPSATPTPVDEMPMPIARAWRDFHSRVDSAFALAAAGNYFDTVVQLLVFGLAAPVIKNPAFKGELAKLLQPLSTPQRTSGWATVWRNLVRFHDEKKTAGEPVNEIKVFSLTRRGGPGLQALVSELQALGSQMPAIQAPLANLKFPMSFANWAQIAAYVVDVSRTATMDSLALLDFGKALGKALDELILEPPVFPRLKPVWVEMGQALPDGRVQVDVQRLVGQNPQTATRVETKPGSPLLAPIDPERGAGLYLQVENNLLPLEPMGAYDDGEWYALSGVEMEGIDYRCTSNGHRMVLPPAKRPQLFGAFFPQGFAKSPLAPLTTTGAELKADVDRLPGDTAQLILDAAKFASEDKNKSLGMSSQAAGRALALLLKQSVPSLDRAVELLRKATPPIVPTLVESLVNIVKRANQFGVDGPMLSLFAAVRLALWGRGAPSGLMCFNPADCLKALQPEPSVAEEAAPEQSASSEGVIMTMPRGGQRKRVATMAIPMVNLHSLPSLGRQAKASRPRGTKQAVIRCLGPVRPIGSVTVTVPGTIGRNPDCVIQVQSGYISRYHLQITLDDKGELVVVHDATTNSSAVNGCKLTPGERHPLRSGDLLFVDTESFLIG